MRGWLGNNKIGDAGVAALAEACRASGSLGNLQDLSLFNNQIGDEGMKVFSAAISSGSLPSCTEFAMYYNPDSEESMQRKKRGRTISKTKV